MTHRRSPKIDDIPTRSSRAARPTAARPVLALLLGLLLLATGTAAFAQTLNPEIQALGDNRWKRLTLTPTSRRLCQNYLVDPADSAQAYPQSRVQNGTQIGVFNGKSYLFYFGGAHVTHPCNDVEIFDVTTATWRQETFPEAPRLLKGDVVSATSTTATLSSNAPAVAGKYGPPNVIGILSGKGNGQILPIASYSANRVVTLSQAWTTIPDATSDFAIWYDANSRGMEFGFSVSVLSPNGRPYAEHLQDYYKYDPVNGRFIGISYAATAAWNLGSKTWSILAGPYVPGNTLTPKGAVGMSAMMEYDPDLAALGNSGFQAIDSSLKTGSNKKWLLGSGNRWTGRGGLPSIVDESVRVFTTYVKDLRKHFVKLTGSGFPQYGGVKTLHFLYDAVSDTWSAPLTEVPAALDSMAYDEINKRLIGLNYGDGYFRVFAGDLTRTPTVWTELPNITAVPPQTTNGALGGGLFRYDPIHKAFLFLYERPGAGGTGLETQTWAYRYRSGSAPPGTDTTPPTVAVTGPANGATVSGTVSVSATASDNIGVTGVQLRLDGTNVGAEDTANPYAFSWNTTSVANGSHVLSAIARDAAGNLAVSAPVTVTVNNSTTPPPPPPSPPPSGSLSITNLTRTNYQLAALGVGSQYYVDRTYTLSSIPSILSGGTWIKTANNDKASTATAFLSFSVNVPVSVYVGYSQSASVLPSWLLAFTNTGTVLQTTDVPMKVYSKSYAAGAITLGGNLAPPASGSTEMYTITVKASGSSADTTKPTVSVTAPASGATVGGTVTVSATASDNVGVAGVQFKLDGANLGSEDTASPYSISWNTTSVANGSHALTALARDAAGNTTTSSTVTITVSNTTSGGDTVKPTVALTAPASGATVGGTVTISATASDNVGVAGVQFKLDGASFGAEDTSSPYSISWNTSSAVNGSHTLTAVGRDAAGNTTTSAAVTVTVSNSGTVSDFQQRCAAAGVVRCFSFDSQTETAPYLDSGASTPVVDTSIKASGSGSLKMTIPSNSGANTSGAFQMDFTPGSLPCRRTDCLGPYDVQFGEGDEFYVQWRQRFSPEFLNTNFTGGGGWKQAILGEGDRPGTPAYSCTQLEVVTQNTFQRGYAQMYHSCGAKDSKYEPILDVFPPYDYKLQNAVPSPYCLYSTSSVPPCIGYKPNQWMTFQVHVKIGTWYKNDGNYHRNSTVELWIAEEGQPARLAISKADYDLANTGGAAVKYGKVWLLPYNTGKSSTQTHPQGYVWYDDLIVSRNKIADPAASGSTTPPPDITPPTVSLTAPAAGATVSGTATVSANAADSGSGVAGVQFKLDGANLGAEDTTSPYSVSWTTTSVANGTHTLTAVARDGAGNQVTSSSITVTVSNTTSTSLSITNLSRSNYQVAALTAGSQYYVDRTYTLPTLPALLGGGLWIKTANDDKANTSTSFLSFTVNKPVTVYVSYRNGVAALPGWLAAWTNTGTTWTVQQLAPLTLRIYSKTFAAGAITLGGNLASPASGSTEMYLITVKESSSTSAPSTTSSTSAVGAGPTTSPSTTTPGPSSSPGAAQAAAPLASVTLNPTDPWCSLINGARPGTELVFGPGAYTGRCTITAVGTAAAPIWIRSYRDEPDAHATFSYAGFTGNVLEFQNAAHLIVRGFGFAPTQPGVDAIRIRQASDLAFEVNTFTGIGGVSMGANTGDTQRITVRQNSFVTVEGTALSFGCEDGTTCRATELLIEENIIDRTTSAGVAYGIEVKLNSSAVIRSNLISTTLSAGIFVQGANVSDTGATIEQNYVEHTQAGAGIVVGGGPAVVTNNILLGNAGGGISAPNYAGRNLQQNVWIVHNTVLDNAQSGISVTGWSAGGGNVMAFNAIGPRAGTPSLSPAAPAATVTGNVTCNPFTACFVQAATAPYDLTPLPGGPLFNTAGAGAEAWRPTVDFFGTPRVGAADVGAVEAP